MPVTPNETTFNFGTGIAASSAGGKITINVDGTVVSTSGDQTIAGNKTFTGNTTLGNTTVSNGSTVAVGDSSNTLTTQTAAQINTGNGLTSGQALAVNTGSSAFTTGAGSGFFYGGGSDSLSGATTFKSTGNFTGTLVALTADQTTAGTVLGISAQNLTTGKAIDVSLGTLYSGTTDAVGGYTIGAVNVRAQSFTGNVFNVSAQGAGGVNANLANFQSSQLAGQVLNVNATSLTTGRAVAVTLGNGGTGLYVNTGSAYSGNLAQLQVNGSDRLVVDQTGNTTLAGTLAVRGASITGPTSGAFAIDNGNASDLSIGATNATTLNLGRSGQLQALLGNATVAGTLGVSGNFTVGSSTFNVTAASGNTTISGTLGVTGATTLSNTLAVSGNTTVGGTLGVTGATTLSSTLGVTGNATFGGTITGPTAATFSIDSGGANAINLGGINATTVNIGRAGQTQALLGNATIAGTLVGGNGGAFAINASGGSTLDLGGTAGTGTVNIGRSGQTQALLGNATVAGNLTQSGTGTLSTGSGQITLNGPVTVTQSALQGGALVSSAAGVVSAVAPGASGNVLTSDGTSWVSQAPAASLAYQEIGLASDYSVTTSMATITGMTLSLDAGTWLVFAHITVQATSTTEASVGARIRDTTNSVTVATGQAEVDTSPGEYDVIAMHGIRVLTGSATIALQVEGSTNTPDIQSAAVEGDTTAEKATRLTAIKIAP